MADPGLKISIGSDVTGAIQGLRDINITLNITRDAFDKTGKAAKQAGNDIGNGLKEASGSSIRSIAVLEAELAQLHAAIVASADLTELKRLSDQFKKTTLELNNLKVVGLETSLKNVGKAGRDAGSALGAAGKAGDQAGLALSNVGRIAQDLPFGFVGIQNNLNPLLESFQRLKATTGSTGAAFKALGSSLLGAGGVGLALSAISAAILIYQNGIAGFNKKTKEAKEAADAYKKSLEGISSQIGDEAARVSVLVRALTEETLTRKQRQGAIKELQQINPDYFAQLKDEKGLVDNLTLAYKNYLTSLKAQFATKALDKQLAGLFDKKIQLETSLDPKLSEDTDRQLSKIRAKFQEEFNKLGGSKVDFDKLDPFNLTETQKRLIELRKLLAQPVAGRTIDFSKQSEELRKVNIQIDELLGRRTGLDNFDIKVVKDSTATKQDAILKALRKELAGYQKEIEKTNQLREAGELPLNRENDALETQLKIFDTLNKIDAREVAIKAKPELEIDPELVDLQIKKAIDDFNKRSGSRVTIPVTFDVRPVGGGNLFSPADVIAPNGIDPKAFQGIIDKIKQQSVDLRERTKQVLKEEFIDKIAGSLQEGIFNAADTLGQALGGIFSGESVGSVLANAAEGLLGIIGGVVQEVGKQIAIIGGLMEVLKKALGNIFTAPAASIGIGLALVALGGLLKSIKIPGFADGVTGFPGGMALVGERGPELVRLPSGSDVIPNNRLGGFGGAIVLQPSVRFSGADFQVMLNKVEKSKRNLG